MPESRMCLKDGYELIVLSVRILKASEHRQDEAAKRAIKEGEVIKVYTTHHAVHNGVYQMAGTRRQDASEYVSHMDPCNLKEDTYMMSPGKSIKGIQADLPPGKDARSCFDKSTQ